MSLACRLVQAENNQGPKDSGRNFALPPQLPKKNLDRGPVPGVVLSPEISAKCGLGGGEIKD